MSSELSLPLEGNTTEDVVVPAETAHSNSTGGLKTDHSTKNNLQQMSKKILAEDFLSVRMC